MFEKQREHTYNIELAALWNFLINYNWSKLIKGYSSTEEKGKWLVQLENKENSNVQVVEMSFDESIHTINIKITPKFNKHQSYDLLTVSLMAMASCTSIKMTYGYHPMSYSEKLFAKILNHEDNIFDEYSNSLFDDISKYLIEELYG